MGSMGGTSADLQNGRSIRGLSSGWQSAQARPGARGLGVRLLRWLPRVSQATGSQCPVVSRAGPLASTNLQDRDGIWFSRTPYALVHPFAICFSALKGQSLRPCGGHIESTTLGSRLPSGQGRRARPSEKGGALSPPLRFPRGAGRGRRLEVRGPGVVSRAGDRKGCDRFCRPAAHPAGPPPVAVPRWSRPPISHPRRTARVPVPAGRSRIRAFHRVLLPPGTLCLSRPLSDH